MYCLREYRSNIQQWALVTLDKLNKIDSKLFFKLVSHAIIALVSPVHYRELKRNEILNE